MAERPAVQPGLSDLSNPLTLPSRAPLREPMVPAQPPPSSAATRPQLAQPRLPDLPNPPTLSLPAQRRERRAEMQRPREQLRPLL